VFPPTGVGYDRAITIWSPDGRLYQVEYAMEAVRRGSITLGIKTEDGIVLAAEVRSMALLEESSRGYKIVAVDDHIGVSFSGWFSDARVLIDKARYYAQVHRLLYDEPIEVELLARKICDILQIYTQHGGVRPFGVALLIGGVDFTGPQLIYVEPSGTYYRFLAHAIGTGAEELRGLLEKNYRKDLHLDEAVTLAVRSLNKVIEGGLKVENIEIAVIERKTMKFRKLKREEIRKLIEEVR